MKIVVRGIWWVSLLGFLFSLFSTYLNIRNFVGIQVDTFTFSTNRDQFFFGFLLLFIVLNLTLFGYSKAVFKAPKQLLLIPNYKFWTSSKESRAAVNQILSNAAWPVAATLNYFLCYWLIVVKHENHFEGSKLPEVAWFYWPGVLMLISLLGIPIRLFIKNVNLLARTDGDQ